MIETMPAVSPETVTPLKPETVSPLKPSEAFRLGRMVRPRRIEGTFFEGEDGACALGAMAESVGVGGMYALGRSLPGLNKRWLVPCPEGTCHYRKTPTHDVMAVVWHLNDLHEWPDARILVWLEALGL